MDDDTKSTRETAPVSRSVRPEPAVRDQPGADRADMAPQGRPHDCRKLSLAAFWKAIDGE